MKRKLLGNGLGYLRAQSSPQCVGCREKPSPAALGPVGVAPGSQQIIESLRLEKTSKTIQSSRPGPRAEERELADSSQAACGWSGEERGLTFLGGESAVGSACGHGFDVEGE